MGINITLYSENYTVDLAIRNQMRFELFKKDRFFFIDFGPFYFSIVNYKGM